MLATLADFGPHARASRMLGDACFGRALYRILPEDDFDAQPLTGGGGRYLLVADVRIDNRTELATKLAIPTSITRQMSDAALLLAAWERWQLECVDHLLGDFALAVWDVDKRKLTLARSPLAVKCLFYHHSPQVLAFASMPQALHAIPQIARRVDLDEAVAIAAGTTINGPATVFAGIRRVKQGQAVEVSQGRETIIRLWNLDRVSSGSGTVEQFGEAMRSELDRAVTAQLRRRGGVVACQLSSGRDSSAVATTAALALKATNEPVIALTGAPRLGFTDDRDGSYLCDESALAALTAKRHDNMLHVVCRPDGTPWAPQMERLHQWHFGPVLNPSALPWWTRVNAEASARNASVLLTGSVGNFSVSAGGTQYLADLWRENGMVDWWRQARRIGGLSRSSWRNVANVSFGSLLPRRVYNQMLNTSGRQIDDRLRMPILQSPFRRAAESLLKQQFHDRRPSRRYRDFRREMLFWVDNAEKSPLACWGLDVRDPTADRRLVELCFSFSTEQVVSPSSTRPIYEAAFRDRIPREVLSNARRGYQTADWFEIFTPATIRDLFGAYGRHSVIRELVDFQAVDHLLDAWPTSGGVRPPDLDQFRNKLLGTLALANFIKVHFPE